MLNKSSVWVVLVEQVSLGVGLATTSVIRTTWRLPTHAEPYIDVSSEYGFGVFIRY